VGFFRHHTDPGAVPPFPPGEGMKNLPRKGTGRWRWDWRVFMGGRPGAGRRGNNPRTGPFFTKAIQEGADDSFFPAPQSSPPDYLVGVG
jgi:hypothetical protein